MKRNLLAAMLAGIASLASAKFSKVRAEAVAAPQPQTAVLGKYRGKGAPGRAGAKLARMAKEGRLTVRGGARL